MIRSEARYMLWLGLALVLAAEIPTVTSFQVSRLTSSSNTISLPRDSSSSSTLRLSNIQQQSRRKSILCSTKSVASANEEAVPKTMQAAIYRFFLGPDRGPLSIVGILLGISYWRAMESTFGVNDGLVFVASVVFWWFQEHILHQRVLHSDFDWAGKEIHQGHHAKSYFHISIDPAGLMIGWLATVHVLLRLALPLDLALSASMGYATAGLVYEWAHYIAHTRVKPSNEFWKRVRDNHIKHHLVDNRYWFGFSLPAIDDWFGTNPNLVELRQRAKADAPPSDAKELQSM